MGFIKSIKQFATGKSEIERKQEASANALIRKKVLSAQLRERERQAIKFAEERERFTYQQRLKKLKEPPKQFSSIGQSPFGANMGSMILGRSGDVVQRPQIKTKGKKKRVVQERFRVI
jgi:hypothetical protein